MRFGLVVSKTCEMDASASTIAGWVVRRPLSFPVSMMSGDRQPILANVTVLVSSGVDEVDHLVEPAAGSTMDAASGDAMARWVLPS
jgi:hypothetical protein